MAQPPGVGSQPAACRVEKTKAFHSLGQCAFLPRSRKLWSDVLDIGAGWVLVKREVGIIGTAVGVEILCLIISREGAKKRENLPNTAQDVFASSHEAKNRRILRNLIVNCTSFASPDAPKVTLRSHLNVVFPAPGAT
jgi:hypothetical protein